MTGPRLRITIALTQHVHVDQGVKMRPKTLSRRTAGIFGTLGLLILLLAFPPRAAGAANGDPSSGGPKPTIVLVHGGWADASSWDKVARSLQDDGYTVIAPANTVYPSSCRL